MKGPTESRDNANKGKHEDVATACIENTNPDSDIRTDQDVEHQLTLRRILTHHPALVWWAFYWAMAGVAW